MSEQANLDANSLAAQRRRWIIAASSYPGVMRWAGLLRHNELSAAWESGICVESSRLSKTSLPFIEGPEALRL